MKKNSRKIVLIYGAGKVGTAVGYILNKKEYRIAGMVARSEQSLRSASRFVPHAKLIESSNVAGIKEKAATASIVFITTKDDQIKTVCDSLVENGVISDAHTVIHMSGAIGLDALDSAAAIGARTASIHPIQSFANIELAIEKLPGSYFGVTVKDEPRNTDIADMEPTAENIVNDLGGIPINIADENKTLYHVAACIASNYLVTLLELAIHLYNKAGIPDDLAVKAMMPLVDGTISNIEALGTVQALTGPIARGDTATIERHIDAIQKLESAELPVNHEANTKISSPKLHGKLKRTEVAAKTKVDFNYDLIAAYKILGRLTVSLAKQKGSIDQNTADKIILLLGGADDAV